MKHFFKRFLYAEGEKAQINTIHRFVNMFRSATDSGLSVLKLCRRFSSIFGTLERENAFAFNSRKAMACWNIGNKKQLLKMSNLTTKWWTMLRTTMMFCETCLKHTVWASQREEDFFVHCLVLRFLLLQAKILYFQNKALALAASSMISRSTKRIHRLSHSPPVASIANFLPSQKFRNLNY